MTSQVLFAAQPDRWAQYEMPLRTALKAAGLDCHVSDDIAPELVDFIVYAPNSVVQDFSRFPRLKAVLNLWAGVENVAHNPTLTVPLARMVDSEGLTQSMVEWVTGHVLRHHLGMDAHIINPDQTWAPNTPPLAPERPVTILGMGALGQACGHALSALGFPVTGWSRSPKTVDSIRTEHGSDGLQRALATAEILVLLLPDTPQTANTLDAKTLALLPRGACIINPGRGTLIDDAALLAALDAGQIAHATLDVFRVEPLPGDDPYWAHPKVTVTPHIAAETRPASASRVIAENIRRALAGEPMLNLVDRQAGY